VTADQLDLFGGDDPAPAGPVPAPTLPSTRLTPGGSPDRVVRVLQDIRDGRLGMLDTTGQIVEFYGDGNRVRLFPDDDVAAALLDQRYAQEKSNRDRVTCKHGAISRPVTPLRLTPDGKRLLLRWSSLVPMPTR
jgi:hypothetical protein